ncbi:MAG: 5-formyltetrahydrofolate cyclo-ligase [Armatimonadetes bacterium]|jgi:5-formyltetrahydrofolate cyclo-ligase|nr:5-formyltetrahydrofolate cyclo-ligase [Armatimonadota bacterium]
MEAIRAAKAELRRQAGALRDALSPAEREAASRAIHERLVALPEWAAARSVFLYVSFRSEVDTRHLLQTALESGREVLVPRVERARGEIEACPITSLTELVPGTWGILEPRSPAADPTRIDLVVAPGLAFDAQGTRLGYGAGYYDRYLRRVRPACVRAALAYEAQIVPEVPCLPGDERLHLVVTEARVLRAAFS